jgi:DNA-binding protein HU-beta
MARDEVIRLISCEKFCCFRFFSADASLGRNATKNEQRPPGSSSQGWSFEAKWINKNFNNLAMLHTRCHKQPPDMTKSELQVALAAATETNKRIAGVFLDTLCILAYKTIKKNGEFVLPGFGKLVKQKRKARSGFNPKTQQKIKIPAKTVVKFRVAKAAKDAVLGVKK